MKKAISVCLAAAMLLTMGACGAKTDTDAKYEGAAVISLSGDRATVDGKEIKSYDYTWHSDPSSEKEWYEGEEPDAQDGIYIAHDIWYYPELDVAGFVQERYDGENEWVYRYTAEGLTDYIFATLPVFGENLPTEMMHTAEDAYNDPVLHITKPGTYVLEGSWDGQIFVDLGDRDETFADDKAKVTLILSGVTVTCDTAPAFIAYSAYECDNDWKEQDTHSCEVDTSDAGVRIIIADGTVNNFTGANVYRMLKPEYKKNSTDVQKKAHKVDGAFYSFVSMEIDSQENNSGILNIRSTTFEGLDSELHLTINGGNINIYSQDDGINVNEDGVSVFTVNGGTLHIFSGLGGEGDVVDSNGYIVVNGGLIAGGTPSVSDNILDSDCGTTVNGGEVINIGAGRNEMMFGNRPMDFPGGERPERPEGDFPGMPMGAPPEGESPQMTGRP